MTHEARQTFIHVEAKKLREKLTQEMDTPTSFFIVKEVLDNYDKNVKYSQETRCKHDWFGINQIMSQCRNCGVIIQDN